jgi:hypothetical protein
LPSSIQPLIEFAPWGVKLSDSHRGHVEQPRPEPVRRTAAPVTMMKTSRTSVTSVMRR